LADLKLISEFGRNDTLLTIEPSYKCRCHCTWCYVELNHKAAGDNPKPGSTFESTCNRAFGPDYDPTDFHQYGLRNGLTINWAAGVEPFQDLDQAKAILDVGERLGLSFCFQTRGTNWREVWPQMKGFAGNSYLFCSYTSVDDAVLKRYEPGTPKSAEREALIRSAAEAGFPVMVGIAPYHPDWCGDLAALTEKVNQWGAKAVFVDPLHLTAKQLSAATDPDLQGLAATSWSEESIDRISEARDACVDLGMSWEMTSRNSWVNDVESVDPVSWWHGFTKFPYVDAETTDLLAMSSESGDPKPVTCRWREVIEFIERNGAITQPFAFGRFRNSFMFASRLSGQWQGRLKPTATIREWLRACWNTPGTTGFMRGNPFIRQAINSDGRPIVSGDGDIVLVFDRENRTPRMTQVVQECDSVTFSSVLDSCKD